MLIAFLQNMGVEQLPKVVVFFAPPLMGRLLSAYPSHMHFAHPGIHFGSDLYSAATDVATTNFSIGKRGHNTQAEYKLIYVHYIK